jgi:mannose-6-phosphate isomerase-like protein (cupin superfamily)
MSDHLSSPNIVTLEPFAFETRRVEKPWGHELIWALTDRYCGKLLFVRAGHTLSLQFHKVKEESWFVQDGRAELEIGAPGDPIPSSEVVGPGAAFHLPPGCVHRIRALADTTLLEVSTPEIDDVIRLEDEYGRAGT